jgi:hypothetical protein
MSCKELLACQTMQCVSKQHLSICRKAYESGGNIRCDLLEMSDWCIVVSPYACLPCVVKSEADMWAAKPVGDLCNLISKCEDKIVRILEPAILVLIAAVSTAE